MTATTELLHLSAPAVQVRGRPLSDDWTNALVSMRVERSLGVVGRATLRFADPVYRLAESSVFKLGAEVTIGLVDGSALFDGIVTGASLEQAAPRDPEQTGIDLVVTVDDRACRLTIGTTVKTYLQSSYTEIIKQLAQRANLSPDVKMPSAGGPQEYLLQSGTDLAFLDELCRRAGCVWWVEGKTLKVRTVGTRGGDVTVQLGVDLTDFSVRASGLRPTTVHVHGWDSTAQQDVVGKNALPQHTAASAFVIDYLDDRPKAAFGATEQHTGEHNPNTSGEASALAAALLNDWQAAAVTARGGGHVNAKIAPMVTVHVQNAGPASGDYVVGEVQHIYRRDGFYTRFVAGPSRPAGLVDTLGRTPPDAGFAIGGLLIGRVSNTKDAENAGRVKVTFAGSNGNIESAWARVVALGGGSLRGTVFQPEVHDEVLLGFERGDSRHPVVIGGLFSPKNRVAADDKLVDKHDGSVAYRRITSRLGHVIELGDGKMPTEQHVLLMTADKKKSVRVGADRVDVKTSAGTPIAVQSGNAKFEIDDQGNITISGLKVAIKAQTELSLEGLTLAMKGTTQASLEAAALQVKGKAITNVSAAGQLVLKGASVMIN